MLLLTTDQPVLKIPVEGPVTTDLRTLPVSVAIVPDNGQEPAVGAYAAATWVLLQPGEVPVPGEATCQLLITAGQYPAGEYMIYVRVVSAATGEDRRMLSGRLRVGDPRT